MITSCLLLNMPKRRQYVSVVLAVLGISLVSGGAPGRILDRTSLVAESDVIVAGTVVPSSGAGKTSLAVGDQEIPASILDLEIHVDDVIKGTAKRDLSVALILPAVGIGYKDIPVGIRRTIFLKNSDAGFVVTSPYYPSLPAGSDIRESGVSPFDYVLTSITAVVKPNSGASPSDQQIAIMALRSVKSPAATAGLEVALSNPDATLRLSALAALLARGEVNVLSTAESVLDHPDSSIPDYLYGNIASGIGEGISNPDAVPNLSRLLANPRVDVRRVAATALRNTRSRTALPALVAALSDHDFKVRYYAVIGLADITGESDWRPLEGDFSANEPKYLQYWKEWGMSSH